MPQPARVPFQAPARRARVAALVLSACAIAFSLGFGFFLRRWLAQGHDLRAVLAGTGDAEAAIAVLWLVLALVLLLLAMLLRIGAGFCELVWLERTWSNLPPSMRRVGPIDDVTAIHIFGIAFVPVVAWFWKLALVAGVSRGLEALRGELPFRAPVPRRLGVTAVILGWFPGANLYVAPFLWEMYARRVDAVCVELEARARRDGLQASA